MGWAGAPSPRTAQAPKGKGFPCRAGPWRVHCPMHPARSAVAPGALETGHAPLPQLSGTMVQLQLLLTRVPTVSRWQPLAFHNQFQPPWERPLTASKASEIQPITRRLSPQKANHHPCLRLSNSQMEFEVFSHIGTATPAVGCSRSRAVGDAMGLGLAWCLGEPERENSS